MRSKSRIHICAGCGIRILIARGGGLWMLPDGKLVGYVFCQKCADEHAQNPTAVMARVERRLVAHEAIS